LSQSGVLTVIHSMVNDLDRFANSVAASPVLLATEKQYTTSLLTSFRAQATKDADMIASILADGSTSMSDGERITRLAQIVETIKQQHRTAENFIDQTGTLMARRMADQNDIHTIQSLY
jgi:hypothetical protein